jgi:hypothetical protein
MSYIDDLNYLNDSRNCERAPETITVSFDDDEIELPSVFEVCPVCDGKGTHVNPAIDSGGINPDTFHDDPDFYDDYRNGVFDQQCNRCGGLRVVKVVDRDTCSPKLLAAYDQQVEDDAAAERVNRQERAMGA